MISRRALLQADNASVAVSGTILDLSDLGAFVTASPETIAVVRPGAKVQLVFRTPDPTGYQHLLVQGIVLWMLYAQNRSPRIGILAYPLGGAIVAKAFWDGASDLANGRPIRWGGKEYILAPRD